mgnify:CR=1 FL=1
MCIRDRLQSAPGLQAPPGGISSAWVEVLGLVLRNLQAWATALAELAVQAPVVGYELLDDKGRIVAEAEMGWEVQRVAILLPETGAEAKFAAAGWTCFMAADGPVPTELKNKLTEAHA